MARWMQPTESMVVDWSAWMNTLPEKVRPIARKFEPWTLFKLKTSGKRVFVTAFDEAKDGSAKPR